MKMAKARLAISRLRTAWPERLSCYAITRQEHPGQRGCPVMPLPGKNTQVGEDDLLCPSQAMTLRKGPRHMQIHSSLETDSPWVMLCHSLYLIMQDSRLPQSSFSCHTPAHRFLEVSKAESLAKRTTAITRTWTPHFFRLYFIF